MAIMALGAIQRTVRMVIQKVLIQRLRLRVALESGIFFQMTSTGRGARVTVAPWGFFLRQA